MRLAALCTGIALAAVVAVQARASAVVDPHAEVAAALFAASATQAAEERVADAAIRAERGEIDKLTAQVKAGAAQRAQLVTAQEHYVAELAAKDQAYNVEISVFRGAVTDIAATPEGADALAKFNDGDEIGALSILDKLSAARDEARHKAEDIQTAAEHRRIAELALEARDRGKVDTASVISRFEDVAKLDPGENWDWVELTQLYMQAGRLTDAAAAAQGAVKTAATDRDRSVALMQMGDVDQAADDLDGARKAFAQCLDIDRKALAAGPATGPEQRDVEIDLIRLAFIDQLQDDFAGARARDDEAYKLAQGLAAANPTHALLKRDVSVAMTRLGGVEALQGDLGAARKSYEADLAVLRDLATARPDSLEAQRDLATGLDQLAHVLQQLSDLADARKDFEAALEIDRKAADADAKSAQGQRDVGVVLENLGALLEQQGEGEAGRRDEEEAVDHLKRAAADPTFTEAQADLAAAEQTLGDARLGQSDFSGAEADYRASSTVFQKLAADHPGSTQDQRNLAVSDERFATLASMRSDVPGARKAIEAALVIDRRLAAAQPGSSEAQRELMVDLNKLAPTQGLVGDWTGDRASVEAALVIARKLAAADPNSALAASDLAAGLDFDGEALVMVGDPASARAPYARALDIRRRLAADDPSSAAAQRNLAFALLSVGDVAETPADAIKAYQEGLDVVSKLAVADPNSAKDQRVLLLVGQKLGQTMLGQGDLAGARKAFEAVVVWRRTSLEAAPDDPGLQRDLAVQLNRLGDLSLALKDIPAALSDYQESLAICRKLAANHPAPQTQFDVAYTLGRLAGAQAVGGDLGGAQKTYGEALTVSRDIAAAQPTSLDAARGVATAMAGLAGIAGSSVKWADVVAYIEGVKAKMTLTPSDEHWLDVFRQRAAAEASK